MQPLSEEREMSARLARGRNLQVRRRKRSVHCAAAFRGYVRKQTEIDKIMIL